MLVNFDDLSPPDIWSPDKQEAVSDDKGMLGNFQICGKEDPRGYWVGAFLFPQDGNICWFYIDNT